MFDYVDVCSGGYNSSSGININGVWVIVIGIIVICK